VSKPQDNTKADKTGRQTLVANLLRVTDSARPLPEFGRLTTSHGVSD
jgi:hypothetical protein